MTSHASSGAAYEFVKKEINAEALEQGINWYDRHGRLYLITDMNKHHCFGAMKKLLLKFGGKVVITPLFKALITQADQ